ncbi:rhodanese-like domain-containing protein [Pelagibacteraceae bacterium]|jgi:thiosulfate/3-mercaptopyruvate sulfurtransferase|nr:rhodanese-like domain-containing protein [Pelagibacteraceae bacterium]
MGLVNTDWLRKNLLSDNIKILDCSWHMPNSERSGKLEFEACHIPGSIFFDIDEFSDKKSSFPHTVLPDDKFSLMISDLGISNQDHIVVYDTLGIFSSPRVWWMFNYYGHNQISILDGGLIKWCKEKKEVESGKSKKYSKTTFTVNKNHSLLKTYEDIKKNISNNSFQILDARSKGRFEGIDAEPRKNLRSGSITNSINLPWNECIDPDSKCFLEKPALEQKFKSLKIDDNQPIVFSCGSGISACVIGKAFNIINNKPVNIYDGSWTEWATKEGLFS